MLKNLLSKEAWRRVPRRRYDKVFAFLRPLEACSVSACSRLLGDEGGRIQVWAALKRGAPIKAIILKNHRTLYPVFNGEKNLPPFNFLKPTLFTKGIYAVQGLSAEAAMLDTFLAGQRLLIRHGIDYDLMALDGPVNQSCLRSGPGGLELRQPEMGDFEAVYALEEVYQKEEVLPAGSVFNAEGCRLLVEELFRSGTMLIAVLGKRIAGKININARSFSRSQIGGVFVAPEFRGLGIATKMAAVFCSGIIGQNRGVSLFVKKTNTPAQAVYRKIGFRAVSPYRISYY
jgi:ribosomal protein S18 acetylase RimI-like enzyme